MTIELDYQRAIAAYPSNCQPLEVESLGSAGGFSGARFWKLDTTSGPLCLRRWPAEMTSADRLEFIQAVLWQVDQQGFRLAPLPLETQSLSGYVREAGYFWDLSPWMPGEANYCQSPNDAKLVAAMRALGQFHLAAAGFPLPHPASCRSPGIVARQARLRSLQTVGFERLVAAVDLNSWPELAARAVRLFDLFRLVSDDVEKELARAAELRIGLQPCIRDIWHDHVLFEGDEVSGLIDFGALRADNVATDIARLLGSLAADDSGRWPLGIDAYQSVRPLSDAEQQLIGVFDRSAVLLSGFNWLEWVYLEGRQFDDRRRVEQRLDTTIDRLAHLASLA